MVMIERATKYICGICWTRYDSKNEAEECEKRGTKEPKFKVGDAVKITATNFTNKKFGGKTGTIKRILYCRPIEFFRTTDPHVTRYDLCLKMEDEFCNIIVGEEILEVE